MHCGFRFLHGKSFFFKYLFAQGRSQTPHPFFLPTSFLYVKLVAREHRMSFRTLAPQLTVLDIPYFASYRLTQLLRPIPRSQSVMIHLYITALIQSTNFPCSSISLSRTQQGPQVCCRIHCVELSISQFPSTVLITRFASPTLYAC